MRERKLVRLQDWKVSLSHHHLPSHEPLWLGAGQKGLTLRSRKRWCLLKVKVAIDSNSVRQPM